MKFETKRILLIAALVFALFLGVHYWKNIEGLLTLALSAAIPLIIGCVIAFIINILMSFYERHYFPKSKNAFVLKTRRVVCLSAAILTLFLIITLVITLIVPEFVNCIRLMLNMIPGAIDQTINYVESLNILPENIFDVLEGIDWKSRIGEIVNSVWTGVGNVMDVVIKTVSSIFSVCITVFAAIIFSIYLLIGKERVGSQCKRLFRHYMKPSWYEKLSHIALVICDSFHRYVVGQCLEALILGILCTVGMLIFRFPYATMIGALIAFTALIPVAGAYIGAIGGAFMILTVSPVKAILFIVYIVVLQQLENNLIYPRVVGSSIGLPGIWVMAAVTVGGGVMGVFGMLLGVPLAAAVYRLLQEDVNRKPENTLSAASVTAFAEGTPEQSVNAASQKQHTPNSHNKNRKKNPQNHPKQNQPHKGKSPQTHSGTQRTK